jgi:hypothetical protein
MVSSTGSAPVTMTGPGGSPVCWPVVSAMKTMRLSGVPSCSTSTCSRYSPGPTKAVSPASMAGESLEKCFHAVAGVSPSPASSPIVWRT